MTGPKTVSDKQLAANRANARKSTGPRTPQGKARSSQNAVKHGILASAVVPPALQSFESRAAFDRLLEDLTERLVPDGIVEELLVQQLAATYWRLARLYRAEAGDIALQNNRPRYAFAPSALLRLAPPADPDSPAGMWQQRDALTQLLEDTAALRNALVARDPQLADATDAQLVDFVRTRIAAIEEQLAEHERLRQEMLEAHRSLSSPDTALKFARYETALQRQIDRTLARLERLQRRRGGDLVAPAQLLAEIDPEGGGEA